jgi:hypothetical protein
MQAPRPAHRRALVVLLAGVFALGLAGVAPARERAERQAQSGSSISATAAEYVVRFYPRWFTYEQGGDARRANRLYGPDRISPIYHAVVAINDDTLYASSFVDLTSEPVILTIPATGVTYSLLTLDAYGNTFQTSIPSGAAGTYALTAPGWSGTLPAGVTAVPVPVVFSNWIFRADRYANGVSEVPAARRFRRSLRIAPLSEYLSHPSGGATRVVPEIGFRTPYKQTADALATKAPIEFLKQLQTAVHAPTTPPLSASDQQVSDSFDALFDDGTGLSPSARARFRAGVRSAHAQIIAHYHSHTIGNQWINFTNIGEWGTNYLDRDAITEYIQYGNNHSAAAYYHAFKDDGGAVLSGRSGAYVLTFAPDHVPEAKRFWSLTAYLPSSIELVPNPARKYVVASYTPGLKKGPDGSISIYLARRRPAGVPAANWLPVPPRRFNVMLRVYGPEGSVADNTYIPPGIARAA